jgi:hypothetical protein
MKLTPRVFLTELYSSTSLSQKYRAQYARYLVMLNLVSALIIISLIVCVMGLNNRPVLVLAALIIATILLLALQGWMYLTNRSFKGLSELDRKENYPHAVEDLGELKGKVRE